MLITKKSQVPKGNEVIFNVMYRLGWQLERLVDGRFKARLTDASVRPDWHVEFCHSDPRVLYMMVSSFKLPKYGK